MLCFLGACIAIVVGAIGLTGPRNALRRSKGPVLLATALGGVLLIAQSVQDLSLGVAAREAVVKAVVGRGPGLLPERLPAVLVWFATYGIALWCVLIWDVVRGAAARKREPHQVEKG